MGALMKTVERSNFVRMALALCLSLTVLFSSSMFALAVPEHNFAAAEITVSGQGENGEKPFVTLNGEKAVSGRTFFSSDLIETMETSSAAISLGSLGRVTLSPNSRLSLRFTENSISGKLYSGNISVVNAKGVSVDIETPDDVLTNDKNSAGSFNIDLTSGSTQATTETGSLYSNNGMPAGQVQTTSAGSSPLIPVLVFAGIVGVAVASVIISRNDDEGVVSPIR